ncbi:hypothetical protein B0T16DRAFT_188836 [Cercophora newfieldiana]|uniref:Uncharacterized protein n=1 Tax=Cercophora newfieldiana TaxID=92897 RepID=A0AA40CMB3_9PEZI|nr:hypothetical protein B0T16DRAFT_188836 [Cercophora newfieldiana]
MVQNMANLPVPCAAEEPEVLGNRAGGVSKDVCGEGAPHPIIGRFTPTSSHFPNACLVFLPQRVEEGRQINCRTSNQHTKFLVIFSAPRIWDVLDWVSHRKAGAPTLLSRFAFTSLWARLTHLTSPSIFTAEDPAQQLEAPRQCSRFCPKCQGALATNGTVGVGDEGGVAGRVQGDYRQICLAGCRPGHGPVYTGRIWTGWAAVGERSVK